MVILKFITCELFTIYEIFNLQSYDTLVYLGTRKEKEKEAIILWYVNFSCKYNNLQSWYWTVFQIKKFMACGQEIIFVCKYT